MFTPSIAVGVVPTEASHNAAVFEEARAIFRADIYTQLHLCVEEHWDKGSRQCGVMGGCSIILSSCIVSLSLFEPRKTSQEKLIPLLRHSAGRSQHGRWSWVSRALYGGLVFYGLCDLLSSFKANVISNYFSGHVVALAWALPTLLLLLSPSSSINEWQLVRED